MRSYPLRSTARHVCIAILIFGQVATASAGKKVRWVRLCSLTLAAALAGGGAVGYLTLRPHAPRPVSLELSPPPASRPLPADYGELRARLDLFDSRRDADGKVLLPLFDAQGTTPRLILFDKSVVQKIVASHVKAEMKKKFPRYVPDPTRGIVVKLERLEFLPDKADPARAKLALGGPSVALESTRSFSKAELLSGNVVTVSFLYEEKVEQNEGTAKIEARIAVRYQPTTRRFEIVEGKGAFTVSVPGLVEESDVAPFRNVVTERLGV